MPQLSKYKLTKTFRSPSILQRPKGEPARYRTFEEGTFVTGHVRDTSTSKIALVPQIVAFEQWGIPLGYLVKVGDVDKHMNMNGEFEDPANNYEINQTWKSEFDNTVKAPLSPEAFNDKVNQIKSVDAIGNIIKRSKGSTSGIMYGGVAGALLAFYYDKSVLVGAVLGGIIGGYIGVKIKK